MKGIKSTGKILLLLALLAVVTGCVSQAPRVQVYDGPKLERSQVAVITMDPTLGVISVNRSDPYPQSEMRTMTLEVLPGKYTVLLFYSDGYQDSVNNLSVLIQAEAGRAYHIFDGYTGDSWDPYVIQQY